MEHLVKNQPLFAKVNSPIINSDPTRTTVSWNFSCDLNRTDTTE